MGLVQQCARPMVVHNEIIEKELEAVEGTQYVTRESILRRAQEIKGIPLRDIDKTGRLATGKGAIGTVIEESWFGYTPNSESEPDFPEAGVELKVTPYLRGKNGIRAKERLVCNIINYMEEYDKAFQTSAFWHKCNTMLLMSYEHLADKPKGDFRIDEAVLFSFPEEDLAIIEHDWETIMEKVRAGRAHELSEGDTLYLAACTKGANASSVRQQPFSELPAKQRAYSLKSSYMTQILNKYIFGNAESPRIIKSADVLHTKTFEEYIIEKVKPYYTCTFGSRVKHEMALEAAVVYDLCHNRVHALGAWDYVSHQVIASPFKPIDYMDKIDVLAMRYLPNTKIPCKYLVTELKKDAADNATIDQVLKYVDWVCSEYAYGDYEAVEACIIAAEYPEDIAAYYSEVVQRYYTLGSHPVRNKQWNSLKLLRYSYAAGELSYVDVTPQNEMPG